MQPLASPDQLSLVTLGKLTNDDAEELIDWASDEVRRYCGWHIAPSATLDLVRTGSGRRIMALPVRQVTAVTAVTEDGVALVEGVDYDWDPSGILERLGRCWSTKRRGVHVTLTAGHEKIPKGVTAVVCAVASRSRMPGGVANVSLGSLRIGDRSGGSSSAGVGLDPYEAKILDRHAL